MSIASTAPTALNISSAAYPKPASDTGSLASKTLGGQTLNSQLSGFQLVGPALAGGPYLAAPGQSPPIAQTEDRPLAERVMALVREIVQTALDELFEVLQRNIGSLVESLLGGGNASASSLSATAAETSSKELAELNNEDAALEQGSGGESFAMVLDGVATAVNLLTLGRGGATLARRAGASLSRGAKSLSQLFSGPPGGSGMLKTIGAKLKSAL